MLLIVNYVVIGGIVSQNSMTQFPDIFTPRYHLCYFQNLDLSYNSLSGMALLALGTLPSLKELHLTG